MWLPQILSSVFFRTTRLHVFNWYFNYLYCTNSKKFKMDCRFIWELLQFHVELFTSYSTQYPAVCYLGHHTFWLIQCALILLTTGLRSLLSSHYLEPQETYTPYLNSCIPRYTVIHSVNYYTTHISGNSTVACFSGNISLMWLKWSIYPLYWMLYNCQINLWIREN